MGGVGQLSPLLEFLLECLTSVFEGHHILQLCLLLELGVISAQVTEEACWAGAWKQLKATAWSSKSGDASLFSVANMVTAAETS